MGIKRWRRSTSDSNAVAAVLRSLGFKVLTGTNVGRAEMEAKLIEFGRVAEKSDQAIVYYAGHGVQINVTNYFLPIDAQISDERDLRKYFSAESVIKDAAGASQIAIVMFDACRDNPFARSLLVQNASRGFVDSRGLAPPSATPPNTMVVYATAADNVAADGTGEHSPFTTGLLRFLDQPGLEIGLMFRKVRDEVAKITDGKQIPFTYGSIGGDEIYLATATSQ